MFLQRIFICDIYCLSGLALDTGHRSEAETLTMFPGGNERKKTSPVGPVTRSSHNTSVIETLLEKIQHLGGYTAP